jgi:hypothetical protein
VTSLVPSGAAAVDWLGLCCYEVSVNFRCKGNTVPLHQAAQTDEERPFLFLFYLNRFASARMTGQFCCV